MISCCISVSVLTVLGAKGLRCSRGVRVGLLVLCALLASCSAPEETAPPPGEETERATSEQAVTLVGINAAGEETGTFDVPASDLYWSFGECWDMWRNSPGADVGCQGDLAHSLRERCVTHTYLELIGLERGDLLNIPVQQSWPGLPKGSVGLRWGAQSHFSNVALAIEARKAATLATGVLVRGLMRNEGLPSPEWGTGRAARCTDAGKDGIGEALSSALVEAYYLFEEASDKEVELTIDYAQKQASLPYADERNERIIVQHQYTRAAAAHSLVGGGKGLDLWRNGEPQPFTPICTRPRLEPGGQLALDLFRQGGIAPLDVLDQSLSIEELVNGTSAPGGRENGCSGDREASRCGSLRQRLVAFAPASDRVSSEPLHTMFGLDMDDFSDARAYLADEITSFARSKTATLTLGSSGESYARYAGTASRPTVPPPAFYAALASGTPGEDRTADISLNETRALGKTPPPNPSAGATYAPFELGEVLTQADFYDVVMTRLATLLSKAKKVEPYRVLAGLLAEGSQRRAARLYLSWKKKDMQYLLATTEPQDGVEIVIGEAALRCAVMGTIEGAPCDLTRLPHFPSRVPGTQSAPGFTAGLATTGLWKKATSALVPGERVYVIKPKDDLPEGHKGFLPPGSYEALGGMVVPPKDQGAARPLLPELDARVRNILAPNPDWCSRQIQYCGSRAFDTRVPLENELTDDQNGVESSWARYVALARDAAEAADALGEVVIEQGIGLDVKEESQAEADALRAEAQRILVEQTLDPLKDVCGIADVDFLLDEIGEAGDLAGFVGETCNASQSCKNPESHCVGGRCVLDVVELAKGLLNRPNPPPDARRLVECLAPETQTDFVAGGTAPLCVWWQGNDKNTVCQKATADADGTSACPVEAISGSCDEMELPNGATAGECAASGNCPYSVQLVEDTLGFFDNTSTGAPAQSKDVFVCGALAEVREVVEGGHLPPHLSLHYSDLASKVVQSNLLHPTHMASIAQRINWVGKVGGYSAVEYDGTERFSTGDAQSGPSQDMWPCVARPAWNRPFLGLDPANCGDPAQRQDANKQLLNAVLAARAMTGVPWDGIALPWKIKIPMDASYSLRVTKAPGAPDPQTSMFRRTVPAGTLEGYPSFDAYTGSGPYLFFLDPEFFAPEVPFHNISDGTLWVDAFVPYRPGLATHYGYSWEWKAPSMHPLAGKSLKDELLAVGGTSAMWDGIGQYRHGSGFAHSARIKRLLLENQSVGGEWVPQPLHAVQFKLDDTSLLDGLQLLCDAATHNCDGTPKCDPRNPPVIEETRDLPKAKTFLHCAAEEISAINARSLFVNFPRRAGDALRAQGAIGAYPATGGLIAVQYATLRTYLVELAGISSKVAQQMREAGNDFEQLAIIEEQNGLRSDVNQLNLAKETTHSMARCAQAVAQSAGLDFIAAAGRSVAAVIECANAVAQVSMSSLITQKSDEITDLDNRLALLGVGQRFDQRMTNMGDLASRALTLREHIDSSLAEVQRLRNLARRSLDQAIVRDSFQMDVEYLSNNSMRRRVNTTRVRYEKQLEHARHAAFLAKRAIEQRLGLELAELDYDLPLLDEPPAEWEGDLCSLQGIDYATLTGELSLEERGNVNFAEAFIGGYVDQLERLVESYSLAHNFHEGTDTAVVSLRDDILHTKRECQVPSVNLLYHTDDMTQLTTDSQSFPGWAIRNCLTSPRSGEMLPGCISVRRDVDVALNLGTDTVPGFEITRGSLDGFGCPEEGCGLTEDSFLEQRVSVEQGLYRLSYYVKAGKEVRPLGLGAVDVVLGDGSVPVVRAADFQRAYTEDAPRVGEYVRVFADLRVEAATEVGVRIGRDKLAPESHTHQQYTVTGFQLEKLDARAAVGVDFTSPFSRTGEQRTESAWACPDTGGTNFQATAWTRNCISLCDDGYGVECSESGQRTECYREITFNVSQELIETGRQLSAAGFAKGNFNYRMADLGVNFVGTGLRDCSGAQSTETCYGSGFLQYSLVHEGPFWVRNHFGGDYEARLFPGRIEHARGLAAERYVTNPLSSADRELIQGYWRGELRGRPLDGNFTLRVWEDPRVDIGAIEDVQLVLDYRYWTRFN